MSMRSGAAIGFISTVLVIAAVGALGALTHQRSVKAAAELYHTANSLYEGGQDTQAEKLFAELLERRTARPYAVEVQYKMAQLLQRTERYGDADEYWAKVAAQPGEVTPEEIAYAVVWLAGPEAAMMTGQTVSPNGGIAIVGL